MTGVDPRIPVKPHPGSQYRVKRTGESDRDEEGGEVGRWGGGRRQAFSYLLTPANSLQ